MSSTVTIHNDEPPSRDRRGWPRQAVQRAVLVFFGENNWGKVADLGESGMSFEFAEAPPLRQRINFKFETMGCMAAHLGGQHFNDTFELAGEVVWTRQFERTAGVRFLDLRENSRQQIRNLISFEATASAETAEEATRPDVLVPESEPAESPVCPTAALGEGEGKGEGTSGEVEAAESWAAAKQNVDSEQIPKIFEGPSFEAYKEPLIDETTRDLDSLASKSRVVRIRLIAVFGLLAILATIAVATRDPARWVRGPQAAEQVPSLTAEQGRPGGSKSQSAGMSPQPFMVEVLDANNKKWLLWFDHNLPESLTMPVVHRSVITSSPAEPKQKASGREQPSSAERNDGLQDSSYLRPRLNQPSTNPPTTHSTVDAPPVIPDVVAAPSIESTAGILTPAEVTAPIVRSVGGKVEPARLLRSAPPAYPPLARSTGLAGEVTLEAFIDADGNVKDVKVLSGPVLLQQAARDAVRQWKYEPARLDGRPVAMHLSVIVKFSTH